MNDAQFRASVVGASEVPALFEASPWLTRFELFHRKAGTISTPEFNPIGADGKPEDMRVFCGVMLEPVVVDIACRLWGYDSVDTPSRLDNGKGLGGHPDQLVICPDRGPGVLEVKTADWLVAKKWGDEPPLNYQLQAQTYAGLANVGWCDLITLVNGNEPRRFQMEFRPSLFAKIEARVEAFWTDVRQGIAPKADYGRDGDTLAELIGEPDGTLADLTRNNRAALLAADFLDAKAREKAASAEAEIAKTELLEIVGAASEARMDGYWLRANMTKGTPDRVAKPEEIIKGRKGYRRFDIREAA